MSDILVLDAFCILAVVERESAEEQVVQWWQRARDGEVSLAMSVINVGEVLYNVTRRYGEAEGRSVLAHLYDLPLRIYEATYERVLAAAYLKAHYPISYADAFAAALSEELRATLLTGDPEFKALEGRIAIEWMG